MVEYSNPVEQSHLRVPLVVVLLLQDGVHGHHARPLRLLQLGRERRNETHFSSVVLIHIFWVLYHCLDNL